MELPNNFMNQERIYGKTCSALEDQNLLGRELSLHQLLKIFYLAKATKTKDTFRQFEQKEDEDNLQMAPFISCKET